MNFTDLDQNITYSYADYLKWRFIERLELIKGRIFKMSPAPSRNHQEVLINIATEFGTFLKKRNCKIYVAPFDVRFPQKKGDIDKEIYTVVQPDISIICNLNKLDDKGCIGAPDIIIEILSPSTSEKDLKDKFYLYQDHGVKEYWIVYPHEQVVDVYMIDDKNKYYLNSKYVNNEIIKVGLLGDFNLNLREVFE